MQKRSKAQAEKLLLSNLTYNNRNMNKRTVAPLLAAAVFYVTGNSIGSPCHIKKTTGLDRPSAKGQMSLAVRVNINNIKKVTNFSCKNCTSRAVDFW